MTAIQWAAVVLLVGTVALWFGLGWLAGRRRAKPERRPLCWTCGLELSHPDAVFCRRCGNPNESHTYYVAREDGGRGYNSALITHPGFGPRADEPARAIWGRVLLTTGNTGPSGGKATMARLVWQQVLTPNERRAVGRWFRGLARGPQAAEWLRLDLRPSGATCQTVHDYRPADGGPPMAWWAMDVDSAPLCRICGWQSYHRNHIAGLGKRHEFEPEPDDVPAVSTDRMREALAAYDRRYGPPDEADDPRRYFGG